MFIMDLFLLSLFTSFCCLSSSLNAQQGYSGNSVLNCGNSDATGPSPAFLYTCNGEKQHCQTFLIFKSQPPYNSVSTIANLTSSDPFSLAHINNISSFTILPPDKEVIVPVNCSCSGQYYQANTSYVIPSRSDTYFTIAKNTYQGLSSCNALVRENVYNALSLLPGLELQVPLRCACPTRNQTADGTKFLLTYLVSWGNDVPNISERFNVSTKSVAYANGFSQENPTLYPFTTLLIPLATEPSSSQTIIHYPPPVSSPISPNQKIRKSKEKLYVGIGIGTSLAVLCCVLFTVFWHHKKQKDELARKDKEGKNKLTLPEDILFGVFKLYKFEEIETATENFRINNRLSGSVYRGVLGGEVLAIKRMSQDVSKEANILKKINHFNLISLYGVCEHHGVFYLVYEYMENGYLRDWLSKKNCPAVQSWDYRLQIALDVANGLHYLHNFTDPAYVHKDINSSNVLLNRDLRAKIANFSLAKSAEGGENENSLTRERSCLHPGQRRNPTIRSSIVSDGWRKCKSRAWSSHRSKSASNVPDGTCTSYGKTKCSLPRTRTSKQTKHG
ncbi:hypothetical protein L1049_024548 [Liquidambar formosana]|uniref:Protein kinase domain-containing protein n=1 Tax=Liquidambar formosana TaxID=63359 RepID=A0AAP0RVE6_LIQFO